MAVVLANAPVSFGAFGLAPSGYQPPDPEVLLPALAGIGYQGIDLGDPGYLGRGSELADRLRRNGLGLAGGWIELPFHDDQGYRDGVGVLTQALDLFDQAGSATDRPRPRPTLAVTSRPIREAHPGGGATMPEIGLGPDAWNSLCRNVDDANQRCTDRGYPATFHPHTCTDVESPAEIERLLDGSGVDIVLDTGHLIVGGGDPATAARKWAARINHLHLKDARSSVIAAALARGADMRTVWSQRVFCRFGDGDLNIPEVVAALGESGYAGWAVVEQDVIVGPDDTFWTILADQQHNFETLAALGFGAEPPGAA